MDIRRLCKLEKVLRPSTRGECPLDADGARKLLEREIRKEYKLPYNHIVVACDACSGGCRESISIDEAKGIMDEFEASADYQVMVGKVLDEEKGGLY